MLTKLFNNLLFKQKAFPNNDMLSGVTGKHIYYRPYGHDCAMVAARGRKRIYYVPIDKFNENNICVGFSHKFLEFDASKNIQNLEDLVQVVYDERPSLGVMW
jgi:hypothetical protein